MARNLISVPHTGTVAAIFQTPEFTNVPNEFSAGITGGFAVVSIAGKVWSVRQGGVETNILTEEGDAKPSIDVVLLASSSVKAKLYYANGWVKGSTEPPDCYSSNGVTPDDSVINKVSPSCNGCPKAALGSRITDAGKNAKACTDSKRVALVPAEDMENEAFGGPMLLRVPSASLVNLKDYANSLGTNHHPFMCVTRMRFDINENYPRVTFESVRWVNNEEAAIIMAHRKGPKVKDIIRDDMADVIGEHTSAQEPEQAPAQPAKPTVSQRAAATAPQALRTAPATKPAPAPAAAPAAAPAPVAARPGAITAALANRAPVAAKPMQPPAKPMPPAMPPAKPPAAKPAPAPVVQAELEYEEEQEEEQEEAQEEAQVAGAEEEETDLDDELDKIMAKHRTTKH